MANLMIGYANSAADRWAAWVVAASLDAALLLAGRPGLARHPQAGCATGRLPASSSWSLKLLLPVVVTVPAPRGGLLPS